MSNFYSKLIVAFVIVCISFVDAAPTRREIVFQEIPLIVEEDVDDNAKISINIIDPADSVFGPRNIPFMNIEFNPKKKKGCLAELARAESLTGMQLLEVVAYIATEYKMKRVTLCDVSSTLTCKMDGKWCEHQPSYSLSTILTYLHGKGFYERAGWVPIDSTAKKAQPIATNFIHQKLRVNPLLTDLKAMGEEIPRALEMAQFIEHVIASTPDANDSMLLSELFEKAYVQSNKNREGHVLWHQFLNRIVENERGFMNEWSAYVLKHPENYPKALRDNCSSNLRKSIKHIPQRYPTLFPNPDMDYEERLEYYFDHQDEINQLYINYLSKEEEKYDEDDDADEQTLSPLDATCKFREIGIGDIKWLENHFYHIPNLKEYYQLAMDCKANEDVNNLSDEGFNPLADWIDDDSLDHPAIGVTFAKWKLSLEIMNSFVFFEFIMPEGEW